MITTEIVTVTPDMARQALATQKRNRVLSAQHVADLADKIRRGTFRLTGEGIQFDRDGCLMDGQHRLNAIILADKAVDLLVVRGLAPEDFAVLNTGRKRQPGQVLQMEGVRDGHRVASALRFLRTYQDYLKGDQRTAQGLVARSKATRVSNDEIAALYAEHPGIVRWKAESHRLPTIVPSLSSSGTLMTCLYLAESEQGADVVQAFCDGILSGAGLAPGDPRLALRNRTAANPLGRDGHAGGVYAFLLLAKTWRMWTSGSEATRMVVGTVEHVSIGHEA